MSHGNLRDDGRERKAQPLRSTCRCKLRGALEQGQRLGFVVTPSDSQRPVPLLVSPGRKMAHFPIYLRECAIFLSIVPLMEFKKRIDMIWLKDIHQFWKGIPRTGHQQTDAIMGQKTDAKEDIAEQKWLAKKSSCMPGEGKAVHPGRVCIEAPRLTA